MRGCLSEDAANLRKIVEILKHEEADTDTIAMILSMGNDAARRLTKKLLMAGIIEHKTATRMILGVPQEIPQGEWKLTPAFILADHIFDAEQLAQGVVA